MPHADAVANYTVVAEKICLSTHCWCGGLDITCYPVRPPEPIYQPAGTVARPARLTAPGSGFGVGVLQAVGSGFESPRRLWFYQANTLCIDHQRSM
jgi:hypothetical protein